MATVAITPDQDTIVAEIHIGAPPERVFRAITDPGELLRWWGQQGLYRCTHWDSDLRPGGQWRSEGVSADGRPFHVEGEYLEVDPPRLLVYSWQASWILHPRSLVRWELDSTPAGTLVRMRHTGLSPEAARNFAGGWPRVLSWMQEFVEKGETVDSRPAASAAD